MSSFDSELTLLKDQVVTMGKLAIKQFNDAIVAIQTCDLDIAGSVSRFDEKLDSLEYKTHSMSMKLLALRQPMAKDLRSIVSAWKISIDLERIGDCASNIAKRTTFFNLQSSPFSTNIMPDITDFVLMVRSVLDTVLLVYITENLENILSINDIRNKIDDMYTNLFHKLLACMINDCTAITPCSHLMFVVKNIERINDHAVHILEVLNFLVHGKHA